ncbi:MAG: hypothetical protein AVDCRST_MAG59-5273 [uncultured Thermomicrobiales bacterium]|uniref:Uncharacterized protein n=1 Tax=uncultured Thermomicrobiales bacterium TaxID=1645740 RepID=A0A6J4VQ70_9BACT|nr:MAG: hypothetical protein AVDCRST_MAG59-5273 [uncultured Thermomicrobiales bacterium]
MVDRGVCGRRPKASAEATKSIRDSNESRHVHVILGEAKDRYSGIRRGVLPSAGG